MARHKKSGQRGARTGRKRRSAEPRPPDPAVRHPRYGDIPLVPRPWTDAAGREHIGYQFDPSYRPPLPKGAVRGDVTRQLSCGAFDVPRYYYVDEPRRCVQCSEQFVFSAHEQKHWYETLHFNFASVAIRCRKCRRRRRSDKALHHGVQQAKRQLAASADDPAALLALSEAIVRLHERMERGNLDQAIAAVRKARRHPERCSARWIAETLFWEARAQALAGRHARARDLYRRFLAMPHGRRRQNLARQATAWLERSAT
jgi:Probable zinc-ribbon domain